MNKIIVDLPIEKENESKFAFSVYKKAITKLILNSYPQFTIGIFGKWGTGKSTLMKLIEKDLVQNEDCIPIYFNPWRFEKEDNLLVSMLQTIRFNLKKLDKNKKYLEKITRGIKALVGASKIKIGGELINYELTGKDLLSNEPDEEFNRYEDLNEITNLLRDSVPEGKRLIIFIDDLDRCLPDKALNLFNSIKSFLDIHGYIFVIGLDQEVVINAINERYQKDQTFGESYVNKIVQIPFYLPFIKTTELPAYINTFPLEKSLKLLVNEVIEGMDTNPREIKRLVNSYILQKEIIECDEKNILSPYRNEDILLKFILIQFRWKRFYDDMVNYHPEFSKSINEIIKNPKIIENQEDHIIEKYRMVIDHLKDNSLYRFISNNKDIFSDTDEMEDYFYFTKASIGTYLDRSDVNAIWKDIASNEKIKIDSIINNLSKVNQKVLIQKIEDEIKSKDFNNDLVPNLITLVNELDDIGKDSVSKILEQKIASCDSKVIFNYLLNIGTLKDNHVKLLSENFDNLNTLANTKRLFQILQKVKDVKLSHQIISFLNTGIKNGKIEYLDILVYFPTYLDSIEIPSKESFSLNINDFKSVNSLIKKAHSKTNTNSNDSSFASLKLPRITVKKVLLELRPHNLELVLACLEILVYNRDLELRRFGIIELGKIGGQKHRDFLLKRLKFNKVTRIKQSIRAAIEKIDKRKK